MDRRRQVVTITAAGEKIIDDNIEASMALVERTRQKMGEERYEALLDLLNDLDRIDL